MIPPRDLARLARLAGLALLFLVPPGPLIAQVDVAPADLTELVVVGLDPARSRNHGGERLWSSSRYSIHLGRGLGIWHADSTRVQLEIPRGGIALWLDDRPLAWSDGRRRIEGRLQLLGPGVAIVAHSGWLAIAGDALELTLDGGPGSRDQRRGWMMALGMGLVILLLLWRGSLARRRLAESRARARAGGGS